MKNSGTAWRRRDSAARGLMRGGVPLGGMCAATHIVRRSASRSSGINRRTSVLRSDLRLGGTTWRRFAARTIISPLA